MSDEYSKEIDLTTIDYIIEEAVQKICKELGYLDSNKGFCALHNRINEIYKSNIGTKIC